MNKYKIIVFTVWLLLSFLAHSQPWTFQVIEQGKPNQLVGLLLHFQDHLDLAKTSVDGSTLEHWARESLRARLSGETFAHQFARSEIRQPNYHVAWAPDVVRLVVRTTLALGSTIQNVALLRRVSKKFKEVVDEVARGQVHFVVNSPESLGRLMLLDGSPLLQAIGDLSFWFGNGDIVPQCFLSLEERGPHSLVEMQTTCQGVWNSASAQLPKRCNQEVLMSMVMLSGWDEFLHCNMQCLTQLNGLELSSLSADPKSQQNPYDCFVIAPLIARLESFTRLKKFRGVSRSDCAALLAIGFPTRMGESLEELTLDQLMIGEAVTQSVFVDRVTNGNFRNLRVLRLRNTCVDLEELEALSQAAQGGKLPNLRVLEIAHTQPWIGAASLLTRLASHLAPLEQLRLPAILCHCFSEFVGLARQEHRFANLKDLDVRQSYSPHMLPLDLRSVFPKLQRIVLAITQVWAINALLSVPENVELLEVDNAQCAIEGWARTQIEPNLKDLPLPLRLWPGFAALVARYCPRLAIVRRVTIDEQPANEADQLVNVLSPLTATPCASARGGFMM